MPLPLMDSVTNLLSRLIAEELNFDRTYLSQLLNQYLSSITDEQKYAYDKIMEAVEKQKGGFFFLYGYGGTSKTFVWNTLSAAIRCKGHICLNVASSGIASLLLPNGRTTHSRFKIPLNTTEDSCCSIKQGTPHAKLLEKAKLIIWDEAPMVSKFCFEALDKCLKDILRFSRSFNPELPFGGKVVVLGGDFRQIFPVIPRGSRQDIVLTTINAPYLWSYCKVLKLTKNMRLNNNSSDADQFAIKLFSEWLLRVGDGLEGDSTEGGAELEIPTDILIPNSETAFDDLISFVYPNIVDNLSNSSYFSERAILAPTLDIVSQVNKHIMSWIDHDEKTYLSSDSLCTKEGCSEVEIKAFSVEMLNAINCLGLPPHELQLKVGALVMLLRNIDQSNGLCNGTRLRVRRLGNHVIECQVLIGTKVAHMVLIPRMTLVPNNQTLPIKFKRRQFPLIISFAMTINKSQVQTLFHVGIYLPKPVFTHGQLYVALSRVKSREGLRILLLNHEDLNTNCTLNVVYREIFENLN